MILLDKNLIKVSAHQPNFIPRVGFWHKLLHSNVFVITVGMQYVRRGFSNRVIMGDNNSWATVQSRQILLLMIKKNNRFNGS